MDKLWIHHRLDGLKYRLKLVWSRLVATHECPVCARRYRFEDFGDPPRRAVQCPGCGGLERHRLLWLFMTKEMLPITKRPYRVLHCAPELGLAKRFRSLPGVEYVSIDLSAYGVTAYMDLTQLAFPSEMFDLVVCSHVLEHIPDDRKAMRELLRVTKVGGVALLNIPYDVDLDDTYEDWSIVTPEGRRKAFGQHDHVRMYSRGDYARRLTEAGWVVNDLSYGDGFTDDQVRRFSLPVDDTKTIFKCERRA